MADLEEYELLAGFSRVWEEVAALREAAREGRLAAYLGAAAEAGGDELAGRAHARLALLLEDQARRGGELAGQERRSRQRDALYVCAALIDEVMLMDLEWSGREAWLDRLLEYRFFRTRLAGRRFFERLEAFLAREGADVRHADLASLYLLALGLGFRGIHRGAAGEERLALARALLLERADATDLEPEARLFPQAWRFRASGKESRLAPLRPWLRAGGFALAAWLLTSCLVWLALVQGFLGRTWGGGA